MGTWQSRIVGATHPGEAFGDRGSLALLRLLRSVGPHNDRRRITVCMDYEIDPLGFKFSAGQPCLSNDGLQCPNADFVMIRDWNRYRS